MRLGRLPMIQMPKRSRKKTEPSNDKAAFRTVLASARNIIAIAGAGLSAASGIPTFRGAGGMWRTYDAMSLATPEAFAKNPSLVWQFYHYRREKALAAKPNAGHIALAMLSVRSIRRLVAPEDSHFTLITQNVDGMSKRALENLVVCDTSAQKNDGQPKMIEMHGRLFDLICSSDTCDYAEHNLDSPISAALAETEQLVAKGIMDPDIPHSDLPHCPKCNDLARPGVVWFGEMPHDQDVIDELVEKADLCLVVGTSSTVYPAASYASRVRRNGGKVAVFNLDRTPGDSDADFLFIGPSEEALPEALGLMIPDV